MAAEQSCGDVQDLWDNWWWKTGGRYSLGADVVVERVVLADEVEDDGEFAAAAAAALLSPTRKMLDLHLHALESDL